MLINITSNMINIIAVVESLLFFLILNILIIYNMNRTGLINNEKADILYLIIEKEDKSLLIIIAEEANITILISKTDWANPKDSFLEISHDCTFM